MYWMYSITLHYILKQQLNNFLFCLGCGTGCDESHISLLVFLESLGNVQIKAVFVLVCAQETVVDQLGCEVGLVSEVKELASCGRDVLFPHRNYPFALFRRAVARKKPILRARAVHRKR